MALSLAIFSCKNDDSNDTKPNSEQTIYTLSVSQSNLTFSDANAKTVNVTTNGTFSAKSSNQNVATVSCSEKIITITPKISSTRGTATITVTCVEDKTKNQTISVTVNAKSSEPSGGSGQSDPSEPSGGQQTPETPVYEQTLDDKTVSSAVGTKNIEFSANVSGEKGDKVKFSFVASGVSNYKQIGLQTAISTDANGWAWHDCLWSDSGISDNTKKELEVTATADFQTVNGKLIIQLQLSESTPSQIKISDFTIRNVTKNPAQSDPSGGQSNPSEPSGGSGQQTPSTPAGATYADEFTQTFDESKNFTAQNLKDFAASMSPGWNLGNALDAHNNGVAGETSWGNPAITQTLITKVAEAGFKSIRIPTTWLGKTGAAPNYTIDSAYMNRVKEVVGYARTAGLKVIINIHHDGADSAYWLSIKDAAGVVVTKNGNNTTYSTGTYNEQKDTAIKNQLSAMWTQIATSFKDDENIIFETMNEIHDGGWGWGENKKQGTKQYEILNSWNQVCVRAIRNAGATNVIECPGYTMNPDLTIANFKMPDDVLQHKLMVTAHFYDPNDFVLEANKHTWGQGGTDNSEWGQEDNVDRVFGALKSKFVDNGIPVVIGECGAVYQSGYEQYRQKYDVYVVQKAVANGLVPVIWDNGSSGSGAECSGLFNRSAGAIYEHCATLVSAIINAAK